MINICFFISAWSMWTGFKESDSILSVSTSFQNCSQLTFVLRFQKALEWLSYGVTFNALRTVS